MLEIQKLDTVSSPKYKNKSQAHYLETIFKISKPYLLKQFTKKELESLIQKCSYIREKNRKDIVKKFSEIYISFIKKCYQSKYKKSDKKLVKFISKRNSKIKILWSDCLQSLKKMDSESIHLMITSPPYYNARDYSKWENLNRYLEDMREIIKEAYRVLDNHRAFVFNVGDVFDNDNIYTKSTWGKRRIPLGAYFTQVFEDIGFTFIDDFIWHKGEPESQRNKNGDNPYPLYQYPINCYEHILVFFKHRKDETMYPCPICGCLKVNGNAYSGIGIKSWECKNLKCFERSKSNRGKRFSLRSILMNELKTKNNFIEKDFLMKWRKDIIQINPVIKYNSKGENILGHTAPFPKEIPGMAIKMFSGIGEKVLDPFAGSFTTPIEAVKLNRIGIGIELNKKMFKQPIIKNIEKHLGKAKWEEMI
ncbi:MAG: site-specific DNA-methyltransferase [Bdellovibrionaceae bacterium]|nr:site-specific DNA-methyltransferase [Pseudobdellovibrionaceae bacterium]